MSRHETRKGPTAVSDGSQKQRWFQPRASEGKYSAGGSPPPTQSGRTFVHVFFQLDLEGCRRLLNPGVVQTSLEVPVLSLFNLPG